jgi:hypothetical protein
VVPFLQLRAFAGAFFKGGSIVLTIAINMRWDILIALVMLFLALRYIILPFIKLGIVLGKKKTRD